ncbi:alpha/beta hydrolase family protein [Streptomyces ossamyceticus]|uniref:alpha/beta hydrolase family protein n=1 Tax=Streptomyces ossamyceticus TaxID=249581 RepID=UPI00343A1AC3
MARARPMFRARVLARIVALATALACTGLAVTGSAASAAPSAVPSAPGTGPVLELPRPTGPFTVGRTELSLRDAARADPWVVGERRELMVSLWYPAVPGRGARPAPYMTERESAALLELLGADDVPEDTLAKVRTYSVADARPLARRSPLVLLSPGFKLPRATLSSLAEDLASRGYVVAGVGHNHEAVATTFPDGRTTPCSACTPPYDQAKLTRVGEGRAADMRFVLDRLTGPRPVWGGGRAVDGRRVAMVGHSAGGYSTVPAMRGDRRIDAGLTLDGLAEVSTPGVDRPFLMMGTPENAPGGAGEPYWGRTWSALSGWKRWLTVDGAQHESFTDLPALVDQAAPGTAEEMAHGMVHGMALGKADGRAAGGAVAEDGLSGARGVEITRAYVGAFLDRQLRNRPRPLLDGPSVHLPEVRFWAP